MTNKHTPGPWSLILAPTQIVAGDKLIATINHELLGQSEEFNNARLIAAAPDLLHALSVILSYDDQMEGADLAKAAIKKAKGGSCNLT